MAFIPNAYSSDSFYTQKNVVTADGIIVATSVSGETVRVQTNNPSASLEDQTVTINLCSADGNCDHLVNPSYKVEYLDEQRFDEYVKTTAAGIYMTVFGVGTVEILPSLIAKTFKSYYLAVAISTPARHYAFGVFLAVVVLKLATGSDHALNPLHHNDVADALDSVLESDSAQNNEILSDEKFKEFVRDLEEGLRSAVPEEPEELAAPVKPPFPDFVV